MKFLLEYDLLKKYNQYPKYYLFPLFLMILSHLL